MHRDSNAVEFLEAGTAPLENVRHMFLSLMMKLVLCFFIIYNLLNILFWQWSKNY
jgi:hypothetical protein